VRVELRLDLMSKQKGYVVQLGGSPGPVKLGAVVRRIVDRLAYATSSTFFLPLNLPLRGLRGK